MTRRSLAVLFSLGLIALTAACGSSSGSAYLAGPTDPAPAPAAARGATVRGTVETGSAATAMTADVRAAVAGSGIRVSAVGTTLGTVTDVNGSFSLEDVPAGRAELRFEGPGIDARLELEGLAEGQTLSISVHVSGNDALLAETEDRSHEAALRGAIEAIDGTTLRVTGRSVRTDAMTAFLGRSNSPIALRDLRVGDLVEVEGTGQADGSLYARKVKLEDNHDGGDDNGAPGVEVNFVGSIESLSPFQVAGRSVAVDGSTRILDRRNNPIAFSTLRGGDKVEVEGTSRSDGSVLAKKIKLED